MKPAPFGKGLFIQRLTPLSQKGGEGHLAADAEARLQARIRSGGTVQEFGLIVAVLALRRIVGWNDCRALQVAIREVLSVRQTRIQVLAIEHIVLRAGIRLSISGCCAKVEIQR